jgi:signal peptidase I
MSRMGRKAMSIVVAAMLVVVLTLLVLLLSGLTPYKIYVVHTGSMSPTIPSKSAVIVRTGSYRLGQVITYRTRDGLVTHRLVSRAPSGDLQTKGDANRTVDPYTIAQSRVIGGVVAAPRTVGYWLVYFRNPSGLASLFLAVICAWLVYTLPSDLAATGMRRGHQQVAGVGLATKAVQAHMHLQAPPYQVGSRDEPRSALAFHVPDRTATSPPAIARALPQPSPPVAHETHAATAIPTGEDRASYDAPTYRVPHPEPTSRRIASRRPPAVILKCSGCGASFLAGDELKAHRMLGDHGLHRQPRAMTATTAPARREPEPLLQAAT